MSLTAAIFVIAFIAGCVAAFVKHPIYGLMTYVAEFYLHPPSRWWGQPLPNLRWSLLAAAITVVALLLRKEASLNPPVMRQGLMRGMVAFLFWVAVQSIWALNVGPNLDLLVTVAKYTLLLALIYKCIDSDRNLRMFLWTHVLGCLFLGWLAFTTYSGGRFEGFGGPGIDEANTGALQIVTGIFVASSLFLDGRWKERAALLACIPLIINALVTTISRSGFVANLAGGLVFLMTTPIRRKKQVRVLAILAGLLFILLTNPVYWTRMESIKYAGEEVEGVDTGGGRLTIVTAQWNMFVQHPFGCGHRCTVTLSPLFLDDRFLTGPAGNRGRASHSTFMTMLVEHGIPGAMFYALMLVWVFRSIVALPRKYGVGSGILALAVPATAASLAAIFLGDLFVDYLIFEGRIWFLGILMALTAIESRQSEGIVPDEPQARRPWVRQGDGRRRGSGALRPE
jgi:O-antigen ligase